MLNLGSIPEVRMQNKFEIRLFSPYFYYNKKKSKTQNERYSFKFQCSKRVLFASMFLFMIFMPAFLYRFLQGSYSYLFLIRIIYFIKSQYKLVYLFHFIWYAAFTLQWKYNIQISIAVFWKLFAKEKNRKHIVELLCVAFM